MSEEVTLWEYAAKRKFSQDLHERHKASRVLCFLCKHSFAPVLIDPDHRAEIDTAYKQNRDVICAWSVASPFVDFISQRLRVTPKSVEDFLLRWGFDEKMTNPSEERRVAWKATWLNSPHHGAN